MLRRETLKVQVLPLLIQLGKGGMPQLDFTVWSLNVIFTAVAIFVGITAYHLDSENDWEMGVLETKSVKGFGLLMASPLDQFGDSLF